MVLFLTLLVEFTFQEEKAYQAIKKKEMIDEQKRLAAQIFKSAVTVIKYKELNRKDMGLMKKQNKYFKLNKTLKEKNQ